MLYADLFIACMRPEGKARLEELHLKSSNKTNTGFIIGRKFLLLIIYVLCTI